VADHAFSSRAATSGPSTVVAPCLTVTAIGAPSELDPLNVGVFSPVRAATASRTSTGGILSTTNVVDAGVLST
jgi:hypothetical protein